jgi:putative tryptophan/tyrosine transport system substrate-binding protein
MRFGQYVRRREFITLLGAASTWPLAARAQQAERVRRIGVLMGIAASDPEGQTRLTAFRQALREINWVEGRNIGIDDRWGAGDAGRIKDYAAELVSLAPDVILATNTPTVRALAQATRTLPIVFAGLSDPIGDGFVTSLSKPGGNITGFSSLDPAIAGKWLQLLKEIKPGILRIAVIFNPDTAPHSLYWPAIAAAAPSFAVTVIQVTVRDSAIESAFATLGREPGSGLVLMPDIFTFGHRKLIYALAAQHRVPTVYPFRYHAADGGLMSYGSDITDQFRRAAAYIDRIFQGARPADLPVQAPTKFEFVINLKTAKTLGLEISPNLLALADEVIE